MQFNETKQDERLHDLYAKEEEELAQMLAGKYNVEYIDLTSRSIDSDALRLIPEAVARAGDIAAFSKVNKTILIAMRAPEREGRRPNRTSRAATAAFQIVTDPHAECTKLATLLPAAAKHGRANAATRSEIERAAHPERQPLVTICAGS